LLYRRGNFSGSIDQMICDALMAVKDCDIALSPGFRWGTTILPGEAITLEHVMDQTAITYPWVGVNNMTGAQIKIVLEDVADNLFNPDPYYQQGGDMVRVGGLTYTCTPKAAMGSRINDIQVGGKPLDASRGYKVAGWASVSREAKERGGEPVWDVVAQYLKTSSTLKTPKTFVPKLIDVAGNQGIA
jgi:S-sulfosulfanyl-L-cysteine sulfohydrolase